MSIAVHRLGQGPDLVLLHGWGLGPRAWDSVLPALAERFTVHRLALPGYGCAPQPDATLDSLLHSLAQAIPKDGLLCGWSLGAQLALAFAARHPQHLRRLVLVGANARFTACDDWPEALPVARLAEFVAALGRDPAALLKHFSLLVHLGDSRARQAIRALAPCLAEGLPADADSLQQGLALLGSLDLRVAATHIATPTLLIHGGADPLMPLAGARRLASLIPGATLDIFADAAHAPFASDPARFVATLAGFANP